MDRYSELRARAAEFVAEWVQWGAVLVVAPVREAAGEVALAACGDALIGVHRLAFRELVLELSAAELNRRALVPVGRIVRDELAARGFADHAMRVDLARRGAREQLGDKAVVALDLAPRTRTERELLTLILNTARAHLDLRLAPGGAPPQSSLESLQRHLFSGDAVPPRDEDGSVAIFSTSGEALECVEIARRIGAAVERGVPFDQIAIAVRSPERYQPLVVE